MLVVSGFEVGEFEGVNFALYTAKVALAICPYSFYIGFGSDAIGGAYLYAVSLCNGIYLYEVAPYAAVYFFIAFFVEFESSFDTFFEEIGSAHYNTAMLF